jgi:hypothetical protein
MSNGATKYGARIGVSVVAGLATLALWEAWLKPKVVPESEAAASSNDQGGWWPW